MQSYGLCWFPTTLSAALLEWNLPLPSSNYHTSPAIAALAAAAARQDWQGLDDMDVSLCQCSLSLSIDDIINCAAHINFTHFFNTTINVIIAQGSRYTHYTENKSVK